MKTRSSLIFLALAAAALPLSSARAVVIDWVAVGNPGNAADTTGYGAVGYDYSIGKYEVTNAQYAEFLNAVASTDTHGLYSPGMSITGSSGIARDGSPGSYTYMVKPNMGNKPVNYVSWYSSARFANWLHNSQPSGLQTLSTTEGGAYTLTGNTGTILKNVAAKVWIPSEDEWYKAAYYDPTAAETGNYWLYPTRSDSTPSTTLVNAVGDVLNPGSNVANHSFSASWNGQPSNVTTVGGAASASFYGTLDQGGNLYEWTDGVTSYSRAIRGGAYSFSEASLRATSRTSLLSSAGGGVTNGFRLATVPEPGVAVLAALAGGLLLRRRRG